MAQQATVAFLLLNAGNFLLRPLRDGLGVQLGPELLPYLFAGTLLLLPIVGLLLRDQNGTRQRKKALLRFYSLFCIWLLVYLFLGNASYNTILFFISIGVFNLTSISLLWSLVITHFRQEEAGAFFGRIAGGLSLGAIAGSLGSSLLIGLLGNEGIILLAMLLLLLSLKWQFRLTEHQLATSVTTQRPSIRNWPGLLRHYSPLLRTSGGQVFWYAVINTFFYFEQLYLVEQEVSNAQDQVRMLANIALLTHLIAFLLQHFGFERLTKRFSVRQLLLFIPIFVSALLCLQLNFPSFWLLIAGISVHKTGSYAIIRPLRESLQIHLSERAKFGPKNLVDTFFARGGDLAGCWLYALGSGPLYHPLLAGIILLPISFSWIWNSHKLATFTDNKT